MLYTIGQRRVRVEGDCFVAHDATVIGSVVLGHESSVWFNCVLRGDNDLITIGARTNVQDAAVLHTDAGIPLEVGEGVSIGHQVMLHGCTIGANSLIGIGAVVLNNAVVGPNCLIGAKALVPEGKEIPAGSLVVGSPGRVVRTLSAEEIAGIARIAEHYAGKARDYREHFRPQDD